MRQTPTSLLTNPWIAAGIILFAAVMISAGIYYSEFHPESDYDATVIHVNDNIVVIKPDGYENEVTFYTDNSMMTVDNKMISLTKWFFYGDKVTVQYRETNKDFFVVNRYQNKVLIFRLMSYR